MSRFDDRMEFRLSSTLKSNFIEKCRGIKKHTRMLRDFMRAFNEDRLVIKCKPQKHEEN